MINQELPNAPEVEGNLIGAIIQAPNNIYSAIQLLNADCFYQEKYRNIWIQLVDQHQSGESISIVSIMQRLKDKNQLEQLGGALGLTELTMGYFSSSEDVKGYVNIIYKKYIRRTVILENTKLIQAAFDPSSDIENEIAKAQNMMNEATSNTVKVDCTAQDVSMELAREISANLGKYKEVTGVPTGFESYDKRIGGLSDEGDLIILAARPSMGKTTLALNIALNAQKVFGYSGVFFSLEMSKKQLCRILLAKETGVSAQDLRKNKVSDIQIEHIFNVLSNESEAKLFVDDNSSQLAYIVSRIHKLHREHDIKFVIIDYMQLMSCPQKSNREKEIEFISRTLKSVSQTLGIPIMALCQLSRAVETRGGSKIPQLSDLRDSGAIEQDASVVTFLYRPEYYGIMEDEEGNSLEGITVLITKKNRFGEIGSDYLHFDMNLSEFQDYDVASGNKVPVEMYNMGLVTMQDMNEGHIDNFKQRIGEDEQQENKPEDWWNN